MSIKYKFENPVITGEKCPNCGQKSWEIFECQECGAVFCKHCRPDLIDIPEDNDGSISVTCDCGSVGLFV